MKADIEGRCCALCGKEIKRGEEIMPEQLKISKTEKEVKKCRKKQKNENIRM